VVRFPGGAKDVFSSPNLLVIIELPTHYVPEGSFPRVNQPGRDTDHLPLIPRLRMSGSVPPLPHVPSLREQAQRFTLSLPLTSLRVASVLLWDGLPF